MDNDTKNTSDHLMIKVQSDSGHESTHYFALYEGLPEEFRLLAEKELNETEEKRKQGIQSLREFSKKEKLDYLDDYLLLAVLRGCKFNFEKSKGKLKNFVAHRRNIIQKIAEVDIAIAERVVDDMSFGIFPYRDKHGRIIFYSNPYGAHYEDYAIDDAAAVAMSLILFVLTFDLTTVTGIVCCLESKSPSFNLMFEILKIIKKCTPAMLSYPLRVAKVEVLNEYALIRWFFGILSPLLPRKIRKRIAFNGEGYDNLHKLYPPETLPEDVGGKLSPRSSEFYKEKFLNFVRELKDEANSTDSISQSHCSN